MKCPTMITTSHISFEHKHFFAILFIVYNLCKLQRKIAFLSNAAYSVTFSVQIMVPGLEFISLNILYSGFAYFFNRLLHEFVV